MSDVTPIPVSSKWFVQAAQPGDAPQLVRLMPVVRGVENREWASATPSGQMTMFINNERAREAFVVGEEYEAVFVHRPKPRLGDGHAVDQYEDHPSYDPSKTLYVCRTCGSYASLNPDGTPNWEKHDEHWGSTPEQRTAQQ